MMPKPRNNGAKNKPDGFTTSAGKAPRFSHPAYNTVKDMQMFWVLSWPAARLKRRLNSVLKALNPVVYRPFLGVKQSKRALILHFTRGVWSGLKIGSF